MYRKRKIIAPSSIINYDFGDFEHMLITGKVTSNETISISFSEMYARVWIQYEIFNLICQHSNQLCYSWMTSDMSVTCMFTQVTIGVFICIMNFNATLQMKYQVRQTVWNIHFAYFEYMLNYRNDGTGSRILCKWSKNTFESIV